MKFALPVITAGLILLVITSTNNPVLAAIAAIAPNSFIIGYLYDKLTQQEKEDHDKGGSKNEYK